MKHLLHHIATIALTAALIFGSSASISVSQSIGPCLGDVETQIAKNNGNYLSLSQIKQMYNIDPNASISGFKICWVNGEHYYTFDVLPPNGYTQSYVLRAIDGVRYIAG